jgi:hypothetical protein
MYIVNSVHARHMAKQRLRFTPSLHPRGLDPEISLSGDVNVHSVNKVHIRTSQAYDILLCLHCCGY